MVDIPIRHKRGTSDPASGDFNSTAELLVNTTDGGIFTLTDGGAVVEVGGGGGSSGTPTRYVTTRGTNTAFALGTSFSNLDFATTIDTTGTSDFTVGTGGVITVLNAGSYFIEYSATGDQTVTNNRIIISAQVEVNGTVVTGSECDVYSRNTADGDFSAVGSCLVELSANDAVRFRAKADRTGAAIDLTISGASMFSLSGTGPQGPSDIPQNSQTSAYTLVASDNGKHVNITTGGVTVPSGVFSAGNVVSVYNDSASSQTITQGSSVTLRLAGTATTGNRTLAQRGICTILCVGSNEFVISGAGLV